MLCMQSFDYLQTAEDTLLCGEVWKGRALWSRPPVMGMGPVCWAGQLWKLAACSETSVDRSDLYRCFWGLWTTCQSPSAEVRAPDLQPWRNSHSLTLEKKRKDASGIRSKGKKEGSWWWSESFWDTLRWDCVFWAAGCVCLRTVATGTLDRVSAGPLIV